MHERGIGETINARGEREENVDACKRETEERPMM